mgnify:CR=1 FL=1|jgi:transcriptional regulator with XRE-family HTH domain
MPRATFRRPKPHRRPPEALPLHPALAALPPQLAALRAARGISQRHLAAAVGISQVSVSYAERGLRPFSLNIALLLADALDADLHYEQATLRLKPRRRPRPA